MIQLFADFSQIVSTKISKNVNNSIIYYYHVYYMKASCINYPICRQINIKLIKELI